MNRKRLLLFTGWVLVGLAFLSAASVGLIAMLEGNNLPQGYRFQGRPILFVPVAYVSIVVVAVAGTGFILIRRFLTKRRRRNQSPL
jgi:hypothetical protein